MSTNNTKINNLRNFIQGYLTSKPGIDALRRKDVRLREKKGDKVIYRTVFQSSAIPEAFSKAVKQDEVI